MRWWIAAAVVIALGGTARAGHTILIPRADSTSDWGTRKQVEGAVFELAKKVDRGVARLDDGFAELAQAAGCKGGVAACAGAVLDAVAVDELVLITIAPAGDGKASITVKRVTRDKTREASAVVPTEEPEKAVGAAIGPLFGLSRGAGASAATTTTTRPADPPPPPPKRAPEPAPEMTVTPLANHADPPPPEPAPARVESSPPPTETVAAVAPPEAAGDPTDPTVTAAPDNMIVRDEPGNGRRRLYIAGVATGGGLIVVGALLWMGASSVQGDVHDAPNRTSADIDHLLDLEAKGDRYALFGNICVIGGVAVAGTSAFLWWRSSRHRDATQARVVPTVIGDGFGVGLAGGWR